MRNATGFTLMELMMTVAVISILSAVAIPNIIGWLPKRHLQSSAVDVQVAINLSKMTAIKQNTDVVLIFNPVNNSYLAFIDNNFDGVIDATDEDGNQNAGERTIRSKRMSPGINLQSTTLPGNMLTFNSRGLTKSNVSGGINLLNKRGENRTISVTMTGMSRIN